MITFYTGERAPLYLTALMELRVFQLKITFNDYIITGHARIANGPHTGILSIARARSELKQLCCCINPDFSVRIFLPEKKKKKKKRKSVVVI